MRVIKSDQGDALTATEATDAVDEDHIVIRSYGAEMLELTALDAGNQIDIDSCQP